MQVNSIAACSKGSILQYFRPSLSYLLPFRPLFCLLNGHLRQVEWFGKSLMMLEGFQDGCLGMRQFKQFSIFMLPWCIPPSFGSIWHMVWEKSHVAWSISRWLSWLPSWISEQDNFSNSLSPCCLSLASIRWQWFRNLNGTILANINLGDSPLSHIKFQVNPTYGSGGEKHDKITMDKGWSGTYGRCHKLTWSGASTVSLIG